MNQVSRTDDELSADRTAFFRSILGTLNHVAAGVLLSARIRTGAAIFDELLFLAELMEQATKMKTFGRRLKEERTALGLSQQEFGALGGVLANAQSKYEKGSRFPRADYLTAIANRGVDVLYLLTGKKSRFKEDLPDEEIQVIENYRRLNQGDRNAIARLASSLAEFMAPGNSDS